MLKRRSGCSSGHQAGNNGLYKGRVTSSHDRCRDTGAPNGGAAQGRRIRELFLARRVRFAETDSGVQSIFNFSLCTRCKNNEIVLCLLIDNLSSEPLQLPCSCRLFLISSPIASSRSQSFRVSSLWCLTGKRIIMSFTCLQITIQKSCEKAQLVVAHMPHLLYQRFLEVRVVVSVRSGWVQWPDE